MGNENSMKRENVFWNRDVYADCPQLEDDILLNHQLVIVKQN